MSHIEFQHRHAGHCESGVMASLMSHYGLALSEPMAFGLSAALLFAHFPFLRIGGVPLTAYRMPPGSIINGVARVTGAHFERRRFRDPDAGMRALDAALEAGRPVGVQTSVYWLPYFPPDMRFHFNAHNLVVYGRDGDNYLISDPVFEAPQRCPAEALRKARFVRGAFAPRGLMYWPRRVPSSFDQRRAVRKAVARTLNIMTRAPVPWVGTRAIRRLATHIERLGRRADPRYTRYLVGSIIRMQEEIGTGGGGFRFMYASFLQEAAEALDAPDLSVCAEAMNDAGDRWRLFALAGARFIRDRNEAGTGELAEALRHCADQEETVYSMLREWLRGRPVPTARVGTVSGD
ncbi:BtrH N-terminal domain-containing protein [Ectothiorhodospiraceae bacterium WFHF3C12]|nr:BtrH N-terminal domain-containing protein [Ectothiorhodospiraceae bacterium WFHF3C12]